MFEKKIYLCGTVRADRKHMPKNLKPDKEWGDMDTVTANGVTCVKWMDNRSVLLFSNFLPCSNDDVTHVLRRQAGSSEKLRVPCPSIVTTYNKFMGGGRGCYGSEESVICHMRLTESPKQSTTWDFFSRCSWYCCQQQSLRLHPAERRPWSRLQGSNTAGI